MGGGVGKFICIYPDCETKRKKQFRTFTKVENLPEFKTKFCISKENIYYLYTFIRFIGEGYFSKVKLAYKNIEGESRKYAIKIVHKKRVNETLREEFLNELSILSTIDHPNVIKFYETYEDDHNYYLVMEYLEGGDIFKRIENIEGLDELFISKILHKIISAINYCHTIGIVHRDIKPENILFTDKSDDSEIKIIDFGLSRKFNTASDYFMNSFIGTPYFVAPEVIKMKYDFNCDMWSIGATTYMLLTGFPPFYNKKNKILESIQIDEPDFSQVIWKKISPEGKDFVKKLLLKNPQKRMNSGQALNHKFFQNINKIIHDKVYLDEEILVNLIKFQKPIRFKKIILSSLINSLSKVELSKFNTAFNAIDLDHEGFISNKELKKAFEKLGKELKEEEISEIIKRIDYDKNGKLNYSEFLMASINLKNFINDQRLFNLFLHFDTNNSGYIDKQNLTTALLRNGKEIEDIQDIINVIEEVSKNGNNKISFEDFYQIMNT